MVIKNAGVKTVDALKAIEPKTLYYAWLNACKASKFSMPYTFPVYDGTILQKGKFTAETITDIPYIIGSTCTDMLPIVLQAIHKKWGKYAKSITETNVTSITSQDICRAIIKEHGIQQICFYAFSTLDFNWRPFEQIDYEISNQLSQAICAFVKMEIRIAMPFRNGCRTIKTYALL